jgi:hypothetical protein
MASAANAQGIQTLLEAEKEAAKIVAKARQCTHPHCVPTQPYLDRSRTTPKGSQERGPKGN